MLSAESSRSLLVSALTSRICCLSNLRRQSPRRGIFALENARDVAGRGPIGVALTCARAHQSAVDDELASHVGGRDRKPGGELDEQPTLSDEEWAGADNESTYPGLGKDRERALVGAETSVEEEERDYLLVGDRPLLSLRRATYTKTRRP
jgi:hypothetical protein